jgi:hypothetical protein
MAADHQQSIHPVTGIAYRHIKKQPWPPVWGVGSETVTIVLVD